MLSNREFLEIWGEGACLQTLESLKGPPRDIKALDPESKSAHLSASWTTGGCRNLQSEQDTPACTWRDRAGRLSPIQSREWIARLGKVQYHFNTMTKPSTGEELGRNRRSSGLKHAGGGGVEGAPPSLLCLTAWSLSLAKTRAHTLLLSYSGFHGREALR